MEVIPCLRPPNKLLTLHYRFLGFGAKRQRKYISTPSSGRKCILHNHMSRDGAFWTQKTLTGKGEEI